MAVVCRFCSSEVPGADARSRNWLCPVCERFDARACLTCGTSEGFPRPLPSPALSEAVTRHARVTRSAEGVVEARLAARTAAKATVYCERHYHEAYFVAPVDAWTSGCRLCGTTWDRLGEAVHTLKDQDKEPRRGAAQHDQ